jgi:hypothetical protein
MPFVERGSGALPSLRLFEPIQVLQLPKVAQDALWGGGKRTVGEVLALAHEEGGLEAYLLPEHVALTQARVRRYFLAFNDPYRTTEVELLSLLRCALGDLDRVDLYLFLKPYDLEQLLPLTPAQQSLLRHLSGSSKAARRETVAHALHEMGRQERLWQLFRQIIAEFIEPWMARRQGLACARSLNDRFRAIATDRAIVKPLIRLLTDTFAPGKPLWTLLLHEVADGVYSTDEETTVHYNLTVARAKTYFYHPSVQYPLAHLVSLVAREIAMRWKGFPDGFIERVIKYDPAFRCRKSFQGTRMVKLIGGSP